MAVQKEAQSKGNPQQEGPSTLVRIAGNIGSFFNSETWWKPRNRKTQVKRSLVLPLIAPLCGAPLSAKQREALTQFNQQLPRAVPKFPADRFGLIGAPRIPQQLCDELNKIE